MATGTDPLRRDSIAVQARGQQLDLPPPASGTAELAQHLAGLSAVAGQSAEIYAASEKKKYALVARKEALDNWGTQAADAVRSGKIEATQNPWWQDARSREFAAANSMDALQKQMVDAATWPEQNDPAAFAKKWHEGVAAIGSQYKSTEELAGFLPVADQYTQQALATNESQSVQRQLAQRTNNSTILAGDALARAASANGGTLSANQANLALQPSREMWEKTGGDQLGWQAIAQAAIITAARQQSNDGLLHVSEQPEYLNGPSKDPMADFQFGNGAHGTSPAPTPQATPPALPDGSPDPTAARASLVDAIWPALEAKGEASRQDQVSPKGAYSVAQLMPDTARAMAAKLGQPELVALSKQRNAAGEAAARTLGKAYLSTQLETFGNDPVKAVAAYNAGPNRRFLTGGPLDPNTIPIKETRDYTNRVMANVVLPGTSPTLPSTQQPISSPQAPPPPRGPSLYDAPGASEAIETARYYIQRQTEAEQTNRLNALTAANKNAAFDAQTLLYTTYGTDLLSGKVSSAQMTQTLVAHGVAPMVIADTLGSMHQDLTGVAGIANAQMMMGATPERSKATFDLAVQARTKGYSPELEQAIGAKVLSRDLTAPEGESLVAAAIATSRAGAVGTGTIHKYSQLKEQTAPQIAAWAYKTANNAIAKGAYGTDVRGRIDPGMRKQFEGQILGAMNAYLADHPGDFDGAETVAWQVAAHYIKVSLPGAAQAKRQRLQQRGLIGQGGNPATTANPRG